MADTFSEFPNSNLVDAKIRDAVTGKADKATTYTKTEVDTKIVGFVDGAEYDSTTKKILLKHGTTTVAEVDATSFIKDGMVSSVEVVGGNIVITFNTDAGLEPIEIPLTDIFNPNNYYDKTASDARFATKSDATLTPIYSDTPTFSEWAPNVLDAENVVVTGLPWYQPQDDEHTESYGWYLPTSHQDLRLGVDDKDAVSLSFNAQVDDWYLNYTATRTRTDILGYQLGSQEDKPLASEAEAEELRTGKLDNSQTTRDGLATLSFIAVNDEPRLRMTGAAGEYIDITFSALRFQIPGYQEFVLTLPMASGPLALTSEIPYALVTKTISNNAVTLDDRASNAVTISATLSPNTLTINFPTAPMSGKVRDFAMRLNIAAGVTAPEIAWPQGVTLENNGGEVPEIADGGTGGSSTILYFSETENNGTTAKFLVKGETLTAIAQA
jgi:hypothetical protein